MTGAADLVTAMRERFGPRAGRDAPSSAWGVFSPAGLEHAEGTGDAAAHPADTAFRIASCTKSFTASAALMLADEGLLDLDEPLADALAASLDEPLRILGDPSSPTIRHALTMAAGFPTDDPWADRQESLPDDAFGRMLEHGVRTMWPAGARYEYSNLGYALVGRLVGLRSGRAYPDVVTERLLRPLGLTATAFTPPVTAAGGVVTGFRRGPDSWEPCPFSGPGAFSPIGGLFSTIGDLARWARAITDPGSTDGTIPASVADVLASPSTPIAGRRVNGPWSAYGMGLVVREDGAGHRFLGHSGGYPGFGAHVQWEVASGVGAVAFENATYSAPSVPLRASLDDVFGAHREEPADLPTGELPLWDATRRLAELVRSTALAGALGPRELYDPCVEQDSPIQRREGELRAAIEVIGGARSASELRAASPARAEWTIDGPAGQLRISLGVTPLADPRIQFLRIVEVRTG